MVQSFVSVLQLVKSQKMHAKLVIVVETEKEKISRKEFVFDDTKVTLCLQIWVYIKFSLERLFLDWYSGPATLCFSFK